MCTTILYVSVKFSSLACTTHASTHPILLEVDENAQHWRRSLASVEVITCSLLY